MALPHAPPAPPSLVLDTNVVLDMLVYDDPAVRLLAGALAAGTLTAWVDEETLRELEYVLAYPTFRLEPERQRAVAERYRGLVRSAPPDAGPAPELPRCRDRDDQKFLVLAARVGATFLVSKDKRVLSMADHRRLPFGILSSRQLAARLPSLGLCPEPQGDARSINPRRSA